MSTGETRVLTRSAAAAMLLSILVTPALGGGEEFRREIGPEASSVTLNAYNDEVGRLLEDAEDAEREGDYEQAVRLFQDAEAKSTDEVYRVSRRTYLGIREYIRTRIRHWPPEGLSAYRRLVDSRAEELFQTAVGRGSSALLASVARRYGLSSSGPKAHQILGTRALAMGDLDRALHYFLGILHLYPEGPIPGVERAEVLARAGLAAAKRGDPYLLEEMRVRARRAAPDAEVVVGGRPVPLADLLAGLSPSPHGSLAPEGWATVGGSVARSGGRGGPEEPLALYWIWEIPGSAPPGSDTDPGPGSARIPIHPILADGQVVVVGHTTIHSLRLPQPAATTEALEGTLAKLVWKYPAWRLGSEEAANSRRGQPPVHAMASEGQLAVPFREADQEFDRILPPEDAPDKTALLVFNLREQGKLVEHRGREDPLYDGQYSEVVFSGAPVVLDGRIYIAGTRSERLVETLVYCFEQRGYPDALTPLWTTSVCMGSGRRQVATHEEEAPASSISVRNGILYLCSNTGAVAALDAEEGDIVWIYTYETEQARLGLYTREEVTLTTWFRNPVVLDHRYVYAAPMDSRHLHILFQQFQRPEEARTFDVAHDRFNALQDVVTGFDPEYLIGAQDGVVFLAGSSRGGERPLFAVKAGPAFYGSDERAGDQSRILWRAEIEEDAPHGRGVLAGDAIYFPTEKGIYRVEAADGRMTRLVDPADFPGISSTLEELGIESVCGNLAVAGPWLVAAGERTVALFGPAPPEKVKRERDD